MYFVGSADTEFTKRSCNLQFEGSGVHVLIAEDVSLCALLAYMKGFTLDNNKPQSLQSQIVKNIVESCNFARDSRGMTVTGRLGPSRLASLQAVCRAGHFWPCARWFFFRWGLLSSARESGQLPASLSTPTYLACGLRRGRNRITEWRDSSESAKEKMSYISAQRYPKWASNQAAKGDVLLRVER